MAEKSLLLRWEDWRPPKWGLFWSCVSVSILTMVVGFTWGGWVTGGTAKEMTQEARRNLAATFCVNRFVTDADAAAQYAKFMQISDWQRDEFIHEGGWAKMPPLDRPLAGIADLCADKLATIQMPVAKSTTGASTTDGAATTTVVQ
ncbi:MAG TPA: hypothetical protein VJV39_12395 [Dongiaceae bacterium]|nr:hypothetical protein [Dongiaceae bacterium]